MRQKADEVCEFVMWLQAFELDPYAFKAYITLVSIAREETDAIAILGDEEEVTLKRLAKLAGMSERRFQQAVTTLESRGMMRRRFRQRMGSIYFLFDIPSPAEDGTWVRKFDE